MSTHSFAAGPGIRVFASLAILVLAVALLAVFPVAPAAATNARHHRVVSDNPADWTPHVLDGTVYRILQVGNRVYIGGSFTKVRNASSRAELRLPSLIAFSATTGNIDTSFRPAIDGPVRALAASPDGRSIYVGGKFYHAGGRTARNLAKLDAYTGRRWDTFKVPTLDGVVSDMRLVGQRLIISGSFQSVGGTARRALAALNAETGALQSSINLDFNDSRTTASGSTTPVKVEAFDVSADGRRLVAIGNFSKVAGQARHQLAVVNMSASRAWLSGWATNRYEPECDVETPTYMRGVDISGDGRWFVVVTTGYVVKGHLCDAAARWDLDSERGGREPTWVNHTGSDTLLSVAITGAAVYVGGHQRWLDAKDEVGQNGGVPRSGIGAIHPTTGRALSWNPTKARGVGTADIYATPAGLWIGSDTSTVANEYHGRIAFFPLP